MSRKLFAMALLGVVIGLAIPFLGMQQNVNAQQQKGAATWEYQVVSFTGQANVMTQLMNNLAADRWEYVGLVATHAGGGKFQIQPEGHVAFKREKKQ